MPSSNPSADLLVQTMNSLGRWTDARPLSHLTWGGEPVTLSDQQIEQLRSGREVRFASDWYANVRVVREPARPVEVPTPAFTCPRCGGHRSTTLAGRCDDCDQ